MNAQQVAIDLSAMGTTILFLVLSLAFCMALSVAIFVLGQFGGLLLGFAAAVAGDRSRSSYGDSRGSFGAVTLRALVYLSVCVAAIVSAALGHAFVGNVLAIAGGIALGIALVKMVTRLR